MAKSTAFSTALLQYLFNGTAISGLTGTLYAALHTADPGAGGNQSTSEAAYTGYARVALDRSSTDDFTVTGASVSPAAAISFPEATASGTTCTHFSIGLASSGAGVILYSGELEDGSGNAQPISITSGTVPQIRATSTITEA